jgi:hypothetical protein
LSFGRGDIGIERIKAGGIEEYEKNYKVGG